MTEAELRERLELTAVRRSKLAGDLESDDSKYLA